MKPKKLPRARVIRPGVLPVYLSKTGWRMEIDCPTAKRARALAAFFNLSEEEQVERAALALYNYNARGKYSYTLAEWRAVWVGDEARRDGYWTEPARAILTALTTPANERHHHG